MQIGEKGERRRAQDFLEARTRGGAKLDPGNGRESSHGETPSKRESAKVSSL
jgi:hypothetical protein